MLLKDSTYSPWVYTSNTTSNTVLPVVDAAYTSPSKGKPLCSSGATTGQICRYKIEDSEVCIIVSGETTCHAIKMSSDQNLDGVIDCLGSQPGDSDGAVYDATKRRDSGCWYSHRGK